MTQRSLPGEANLCAWKVVVGNAWGTFAMAFNKLGEVRGHGVITTTPPRQHLELCLWKFENVSCLFMFEVRKNMLSRMCCNDPLCCHLFV